MKPDETCQCEGRLDEPKICIYNDEVGFELLHRVHTRKGGSYTREFHERGCHCCDECRHDCGLDI